MFLFGVGIIIVAVATLWASVQGIVAFRSPAGRLFWFRALVSLSAAGVIWQLIYAFAYWYPSS